MEFTMEHVSRAADAFVIIEIKDDGLDRHRNIIADAWETARFAVQAEYRLRGDCAPLYFYSHMWSMTRVDIIKAIMMAAIADQSGIVIRSILHMSGDTDSIIRSFAKRSSNRGRYFAD